MLGCVLVLSACTVPGPSAEAMTEDNTDGARELGPGLIEIEPTDCDQPRSTD